MIDRIETVLAMWAREGLDGLTSGLALLGEDSGVVGLIDAILAPAAAPRLERQAQASYEHAFGFSKLVLLEQPGIFKLRLHLWPQGARETDLHDHRWDFGSLVLRGGYRFEDYALTPGDAWHRCRYHPTHGRDHFVLEDLGRGGADCIRAGRVGPGTVYGLAAGTAHRAWAHGAEPTVSLVLQGRDLRPSTTVLTRAPRIAGPTARIAVQRLKPARYRQCLEAVRQRLLEPARPEARAG